jgi:hypothetical protein
LLKLRQNHLRNGLNRLINAKIVAFLIKLFYFGCLFQISINTKHL